MAKKVAKKLGLEDLGKAKLGDKICKDCGTELQFGEDEQGNVWSYCPKCQKKIAVIEQLQLPPLFIINKFQQREKGVKSE